MSIQKERRIILWFDELSKDDVPLVGGKNANLGEMINAGIPVPPGFAVTAYAYKRFINETGIKNKIYDIIKETIKERKPEEYEEASKKIRNLIENTPMPHDIEDKVRESYRELSRKMGKIAEFVAVRSSATAEDLPGASFAGQQETYLNVKGEDNVVKMVQKCWSSLFTPRAIFYREEKGFKHEKVLISIAVQKMVNAKAAGVMFTLHPVTGDRDKIVIEGNWGLGEAVVSGSVTPDEWVVDKNTLEILEKRIVEKDVEYIRDIATGKTIHSKVPQERREIPCLTEEEVKELAKLAIKIEKHYNHPQDIEWAIDRDLPFPQNVFILQSRPETVWSLKGEERIKKKEEKVVSEKKVVVRGLPASPGIAFGKVKIAFSPEEANKVMKKGDILVTVMTNPDWVPYMRLASAIVTDEGGMTCHAAIVSRELGIPCIVGTRTATKTLKHDQEYTVDAKTGVVYEGKIEELIAPEEKTKAETYKMPIEIILKAIKPPTGTKVYMNLGVPEKIEDYKDLPFDGIGLMRIEFILASYIGEHPLYLIEMGKEKKFIDKLADGIAMVARAIYPKPVVVRFSDFKTNEYRQLKGGERYEPPEDNPMIGWRGVSRYISPQYEPAFRLECKAILKVREEYGLSNVWVMAPFVRTLWEAEKFISILKEEGLKSGRDFKVWAMAEVPSIAFSIEKFAKYFDGFSMGTNDLTQLVLGTDRDSAILPKIDKRYFDERDISLRRAVYMIIRGAHESPYGYKTVSICGQAPSVYREFTAFLIRVGIDSVSVNPDVVVQTKYLVASVERRLQLEKQYNYRPEWKSPVKRIWEIWPTWLEE